jgi:WD40 repeat protein
VAARTSRSFAAHESFTLGLQFTPAGQLLTASMDGSVRLWDPRTERLLATLVSGADGRWLVVAPDGRVDGSPGDEGGASLLSWQIGDVQFPGYVAWNRQHTPGLLRTLLSRATP